MKNFNFFKSAGIATLGILAGAGQILAKDNLPGNASDKKPNIIFILADDLGFAEIGCYGSDKYKTPNIDKLASQGIRFTHGYSTPLCGPSRAVLLTGRYAFRTGATNQDACVEVKPSAESLIPTYLKKAGYVSTMIGKQGQMQLEPSD